MTVSVSVSYPKDFVLNRIHSPFSDLAKAFGFIRIRTPEKKVATVKM
jgi:hypothetical protein